MKKINSLILALVLCLSLCACGKEDAPLKEPISTSDNTSTAELQTEATETAPMVEETAQLATEDFEIVRYENDELWFKVKLRNISDADLEEITFVYQLLDANGDILGDQLCGAKSVESGQAIWAGPYSVHNDINVEKVVAVSFTSAPEYISSRNPLKEKVVFQIADYI